MKKPLIHVNKVTKIYRIGKLEVIALREVSFDIERGEFVSIMGPSGSGKTTLMHILGCLARPTSGEYYLDGRLVNTLDDNELALIRNQRIGFVFQLFNLLPRMTALDNVELPMLYSGVSGDERKSRARLALEAVGLKARTYHYPNELSGGEQQRVAIARALVNDPEILLADEPTGNLDSQSGREVMSTFKSLHEQGKTVIVVTHDPEVASYADRVLHIRDGKIEKDERLRSHKIYVGNNKPVSHPKNSSFLGSLLTGLVSGYRAILHNRLRSLLTVLGIVIGVAAVIGMLGVGEGAKRHITTEIEKLGANVVMVFNMPPRTKEEALEWRGRSKGLTYADAIAIKAKCTAVDYVAPEIRRNVVARYLDNEYEAEVIGTTPEYQLIRNHWPEYGRFINEDDLESWAKICVLGKNVKKELFGDEDPIGKEIKLEGERFTVVGVMQEKGAFGWLRFDDQIFVPILTMQKRFTGDDRVQMILVQSKPNLADTASQQVRQLLLDRHNKVEDFAIRSQEEFRQTIEKTVGTFKIMLAGIAAISLIVGGIGIMNIMLVSVTERTREIGLRKAVGARRRDIMIQFLIESTMLSVTGGIIGILLGTLFANTIGNLMVGAGMFGPPRLWGGGQSVVTFSSVLLAFMFAVTVGIFFGMYPARKAACMDPVEALRYE